MAGSYSVKGFRKYSCQFRYANVNLIAPHVLLTIGKVDPLHPDLVVDPLGILRPTTKLTHTLPLDSCNNEKWLCISPMNKKKRMCFSLVNKKKRLWFSSNKMPASSTYKKRKNSFRRRLEFGFDLLKNYEILE
uniref:Uncharacterized protein n=1 Tax=Helianthus annuus TaxID=4232 RepID=A0A251USE4_HELAN